VGECCLVGEEEIIASRSLVSLLILKLEPEVLSRLRDYAEMQSPGDRKEPLDIKSSKTSKGD
jgi:hypothetical protein